jgi:hypothetical protein
MASMTLDRVAPANVGEDRIAIQVDPESFVAGNLVVLRPVTLRLDYSDTEPEGVVLPVEIQVQPKFGDGTGYIRKVFNKVAPFAFTFKPPLAGEYLVLVREVFHNQWQGRTTLRVEGDPFGDVQIALRTP